jgi:type IV secretory pathway VirB2 component (pilin)
MPLPAAYAAMSASLADPPGASVVAAAVGWVEAVLLGTVATIVAVIAVAAVGFMLLAGRIDVRRGATVILGCFVLFGASTIVAGLQASLGGADRGSLAYAPDPPAPPAALPPARPPVQDYDPYAGASVARRDGY